MACSPSYQHCANCIGALSFPMKNFTIRRKVRKICHTFLFVIKYFWQPKVTDGFITSATYWLPTLQTVD